MSLVAVALGTLALAAPTGVEQPRAEAAAGSLALRAALDIARIGPRPAGSRAERRGHGYAAKQLRATGMRVSIQRFDVPGRGASRNVIATRDTPRSCLRIVMAHGDSMPAGPGANDNASGAGAVIALARRLRGRRLPCDVWLVVTGAEERGYTGSGDHLGSLALARRARARGGKRRVGWALSLDEVGRGGGFWLRSPSARVRNGVEGTLLRAARERMSLRWVRDEGSGNSDHREFELLGMPAVKLGVGAAGEPCRHSPCDVASRLQRAPLARTVSTVERALIQPARGV